MRDTVLAPSDLKTYLKNVKDLEVMCYQQSRFVNTLKRLPEVTQKEIASLEDKEKSLLNSIRYEKDSQKPFSRIKVTLFILGASLLSGGIAALAGGVLGAVIWLISKICGNDVAFLSFLSWGAIICASVTFIVMFIIFANEDVNVVKSAPVRVDEYTKQKKEVTALLENKRNSLATSIPATILEAEKHYQESLKSLDVYYNAGIIYPKYRGIVPITTIYEYIVSGLCTALEGHEGAYNLYENELRMNLIFEKLDDISSKLDQIADNQRLLVEEIRESNQKMDNLSQSVYVALNKLDGIETNTELSAYYDRINASNTSYIAWLGLLNS